MLSAIKASHLGELYFIGKNEINKKLLEASIVLYNYIINTDYCIGIRLVVVNYARSGKVGSVIMSWPRN